MASSSASQTPPLGKYLASTDKKTRDKAVKNLAAFLSDPDRPHLSDHEMDKLWKGIFYYQKVASFEFLGGFWRTIVREWGGIDRLRMDKYYMLIRRFVNASFRLLMRCDWDFGSLQTYNDILIRKGGPLCPDDNRVPPSLKYHLADVYLEELEKVLAWDSEATDERPPRAPLDAVIAPFLTVLARTSSNHTFERVMSAVLEPLIQSLASPGAAEPPSKKRRRLLGDELSYIADNSCISSSSTVDKSSLHRALLNHVFSVASEQDTRDWNRRRLYKFWKSNLEDDHDDDRARGEVDGS
ncbi:Nop52-domain-containing protein [Russula earlei]|uniref:Nop52-domain-containing protein n=1 Tax=Russula earlei TaxID=71964 RepID=A0ACC0ULC2_9AGAM|nr:Nop52-domain-containing protein [Russula earlei]